MKLEKFKERDNKKLGIILFTTVCILLVSGVILYRTFAIFEVKTNQNIINGNVQGMGDLEFAFYVDGKIDKKVPAKDTGYTLNTEKSKCIDMTTGNQSSNISWDNERWEAHLKNITTTKTKCYLYFDKLYVDSTLNAEDGSIGPIPDLGNELVAITFDEENGHALKADLTSEWYDYSKQKWANAVILRTKEDYEVGQVIPEENIESYFVWIPRYEYQLWTGETETQQYTIIPEENKLANIDDTTLETKINQAKPINITFVTKDKPIQSGNEVGTKLTHPAFTSFDSNGFWLGKFETGYNQDEDGEYNVTTEGWTVDGAEKDEINSNKVIIKPNVYSWRKISVAKAFYTVYDYRRNLDSHMMKNMEWGAVAYLTNSIYGRCGGDICEEVRINNSSDYVTGSSASNQPTCGYMNSNEPCNKYEENALGQDNTHVNNYNNSKSIISSTTNNYYGVFDMVGGAWEYVMGVMLDKDGYPSSGRNNDNNSNFIGSLTYPSGGTDPTKLKRTIDDGGLQWPDKRYYDTYAYAETNQAFYRGLFGDATKEFGPFYSISYTKTTNFVSSYFADRAYFVYHGLPWFLRGGRYLFGSDTGIGAFANTGGLASSDSGFRVVLTP